MPEANSKAARQRQPSHPNPPRTLITRPYLPPHPVYLCASLPVALPASSSLGLPYSPPSLRLPLPLGVTGPLATLPPLSLTRPEAEVEGIQGQEVLHCVRAPIKEMELCKT